MTIHDGTTDPDPDPDPDPVAVPVLEPVPVPVLEPVSKAERSLAPDIGRGLLLLFIALANVEWFHVNLPGPEVRATAVDRVVQGFGAVFVVDRSRPMFAVLFGFGIAVTASRTAARGMDEHGARRVLRRRCRWLMVIGTVHGALLYRGDILAVYGAAGLVAVLLVHRSARTLRRWFWATAAWQFVALVVVTVLLTDGERPREGVTYLQFMASGLVGSVMTQFLVVVCMLLLPLIVVGFWLFRSGWLVHPEDHLPQLRRVFAVTMIANLPLSLPAVLVRLEVWSPEPLGRALVTAFETTVGAVTGVGYICGFALLAARWAGRGRTGLPGVLAAVGERSMTAYLLQSALFFTVVTGFGLGLGAHIGAAGDALVAIAGWGAIAAVMTAMARRDMRGPFEVLIRRLTYRNGRRRRALAAAG